MWLLRRISGRVLVGVADTGQLGASTLRSRATKSPRPEVPRRGHRGNHPPSWGSLCSPEASLGKQTPGGRCSPPLRSTCPDLSWGSAPSRALPRGSLRSSRQPGSSCPGGCRPDVAWLYGYIVFRARGSIRTLCARQVNAPSGLTAMMLTPAYEPGDAVLLPDVSSEALAPTRPRCVGDAQEKAVFQEHLGLACDCERPDPSGGLRCLPDIGRAGSGCGLPAAEPVVCSDPRYGTPPTTATPATPVKSAPAPPRGLLRRHV